MIVIKAWRTVEPQRITFWKGAYLFGFIPLFIWAKNVNYYDEHSAGIGSERVGKL